MTPTCRRWENTKNQTSSTRLRSARSTWRMMQDGAPGGLLVVGVWYLVFSHDRRLRPDFRPAQALGARLVVLAGQPEADVVGSFVHRSDHARLRLAVRNYDRGGTQGDRTNPESLWPQPGRPSVHGPAYVWVRPLHRRRR